MIKTIFCCGCYFDKIYYILNSNRLINWEAFDNGYDWIFKNLISGDVILMCDDIFCEESVPAFDKLFKFDLSK